VVSNELGDIATHVNDPLRGNKGITAGLGLMDLLYACAQTTERDRRRK